MTHLSFEWDSKKEASNVAKLEYLSLRLKLPSQTSLPALSPTQTTQMMKTGSFFSEQVLAHDS